MEKMQVLLCAAFTIHCYGYRLHYFIPLCVY